jgi:hypothetical protein
LANGGAGLSTIALTFGSAGPPTIEDGAISNIFESVYETRKLEKITAVKTRLFSVMGHGAFAGGADGLDKRGFSRRLTGPTSGGLTPLK